MCGIAGIARAEPTGVSLEALRRMAAVLRHRGPDGSDCCADASIGLAHTRLAVLDIDRGAQPMHNAERTLSIVFNGEIFNHVELRAELAAIGWRFRTRSDTEVLLAGYDAWGAAVVDRLNGQFAFAIVDRRHGDPVVFLARDRFGIAPLHYAEVRGALVFASEAAAIFASGEVSAAMDPRGIDQVFTFWGALAPRTVFNGVSSLAPGHCATWRGGALRVSRYYAPERHSQDCEPTGAVQQLGELMTSSVKLRLQADVPVAAYLSGGLDSSLVSAVAARGTEDLRTYSVAFVDPSFDESPQQRIVARAFGTEHVERRITNGDIAAVFPDVVRHAETPLVRTAPAPMFILSGLVRDGGTKVVLTGEGSDETFWGYDLFKQTALRHIALRRPQSTSVMRMLDGLYAHLNGGGEFWRRSVVEAGAPDDPLFSHLPRFRNTAWIRSLYSSDFRAQLGQYDPMAELRDSLPAGFDAWTPLAKAADLETRTLLASYLLSSQGDRMSMAHGVEPRLPYLDHRVTEFAATLPERSRLRGLRDKDILRRWAASQLPQEIAQRPKVPYRSPGVDPFVSDDAPAWVSDMLSPSAVHQAGVFDPNAVAQLVRRCRSGLARSTRETQALVAVLSTGLWHQQLIAATTLRREAA